ncbi:ATP-dependent RNA helicase [Treponema lecithinolyticum]|uniref:ATP-dependent RNA helicase n=2 Tax=Treponema lecithinolyticum TaxID=53418 RepID=UPI0028E3DAA0|nr:ATP-dependent RNA helicase [Treponema lecithinolyticum]
MQKIDYRLLPVYEQKERILKALEEHQAVVVQSPTGSGKTTQLPVILYEASYAHTGMIAVTQPRRIAALSVSEFIAKQLNTTYPGLVGYKMRFEDKTDFSTKIKIMTDGILLQEMKLDPWLSRYSVVMVDEAHERSLNIDFVLGLLKRVLAERKDFKVIISSATMNAQAFSDYFNACPVVTIDTITYPVTLVYDPPAIPASTASPSAAESLLLKIEQTVERVLDSKYQGDMLCFLPGEKIIKDCIRRLSHASFSRRIHLVPLYGRLAKEEQERVFDNAPFARKKLVVATNIAETSLTIPGITTVIDTGLAKLNYYNPRTFTSSLNETAVSKASCNQRKGRAGRTQSGVCYRLYSRKDYDSRSLYTLEEIYRTDLSEVVLRMAELGISDFEHFDFISPPGTEGLIGGMETLNLLGALEKDRSLSKIGKLMVEFPLMPRQSRIIVEAILNYPDVMDEVLTAAAFLSAQSPFVLPGGEETDARRAHHEFRDMRGDFMSYVKILNLYEQAKNKSRFCTKNYLDERVMAEIVNIKEQLSQIVGSMGIPVTGGGKTDDYLTCIAAGMIQFICIREGKENYRSLTAEHIQIHPGSCMFRSDPLYIVAGEIVRTSRMFAMSVSPLTRSVLSRLDDTIIERLERVVNRKRSGKTERTATGSTAEQRSAKRGGGEKTRAAADSRRQSGKNQDKAGDTKSESITIGGISFALQKIKGKKHVVMPFDLLKKAAYAEENPGRLAQAGKLKVKVQYGSYTVLCGEKLSLALRLAKELDFKPLSETEWKRSANFTCGAQNDNLTASLQCVLKTAPLKTKGKELGFVCLFTDGKGTYWFKVCKNFTSALNESLSSLEVLADECTNDMAEEKKEIINRLYRTLSGLYE